MQIPQHECADKFSGPHDPHIITIMMMVSPSSTTNKKEKKQKKEKLQQRAASPMQPSKMIEPNNPEMHSSNGASY